MACQVASAQGFLEDTDLGFRDKWGNQDKRDKEFQLQSELEQE